ncbi:unnamed protein product [Allacma fusca]|uniref:Uncharacterized protein n=1 Tax=Allacma fusca TaxID=39272 RepID=A0A8J2KF70_9HEXA|nr:unnamed protein product [Allacma fusca]
MAEVKTLENHTNQQDAMLNDLETKVSKNHEAIRTLTKKFNTAIVDLQAHQNDYAEFKGRYINNTLATAYVTTRIMIAKVMMQQATRLWKLGKVDPDFLDFFNVSLPCGDSCPITLARPRKCTSS